MPDAADHGEGSPARGDYHHVADDALRGRPRRNLMSSGSVTVKFSSPAKAGVTLSNHKTGVISMGRWSKAA
jgi:hypothetical protein